MFSKNSLIWMILLSAAVALVGLIPQRAFGQVNTAEILGTITDAQGAVIPGATITATNVGTGSLRKAVTDHLGSYVLPLLAVGTYAVTVEKQGFKSVTIPQVTLAAADRVREDVRLEPGQLTQRVEVTGQTPALQTETASLGTLVNPQATEDLPLNGRNVEGLTLLVPGSNAGMPNGLESGNRPDDRRPTSSVSINGRSPTANNFLLDGMDDNERFIGTIIVKPQIDALAEVQVETNDYPASVTRTAGGVIDLVTKSGTDQFHGSLYEFLRNDSLDARNFFGMTIPPYHQNQFGGSIGGPIQKGHTFFFGDYEGLRIAQSLTDVNTVPTVAERNGDFAGINPVFNPFTAVPDPSNPNLVIRSEYPGDQLTNMDTIALKLESLYPLPNSPGLVNNFLSTPVETKNTSSFDARIDHTFSPRNMFWGRYSFNNANSFLPPPLPSVNGISPGGCLYGFYGSTPERAQSLLLDLLHVFSPNLVLDARASFTRFHVLTEPPNYGKNVSGQFGIPGANVDLDSSGLTPMAIAGFANLGDSDYIPLETWDNNYEYVGTLNYVRSSHNISIGFRYERRQLDNFQSAASRGQFCFCNSFTNDPTAAVPNSGNAFASFLLGVPGFTTREKDLVDPAGLRLNEFGYFFGDDWKVTKTLTLNLGMRWDYYSPPTEAFNRISNANLATGKMIIAGQQGVSATAGVQPYYRDYAPRFGFAKMLGQQTVLRGGYGLSFYPTYVGGERDFRNPPFVSLYNVSPTPLEPINTIDQGFPYPVPTSPLNPTGCLALVAPYLPDEYAQQYNLTLQRNLLGLVWGVSYVGQQTRHGLTGPDVNEAPPGPGPIGPRRPYYKDFPEVGSIGYAENVGNGSYNALQFTVARRFAHGLGLLANYTYSHAIDDIWGQGHGGDSEASPQLSSDLSLEMGNSDFDIRHRVTISPVYELPFGRNLSGWQGLLARGWQANAIFIAQSGFPFTVVNSSSPANTGDGSRPNLIGNPLLSHPTVSEWFNTAAFALQPLFTIGDVGRNTLFAPGLTNLDFSLFKNFKLTEKFTLEFRTEVFNTFNWANFSFPANAFGAGNFGVISSTGNNQSREIQFALKLLF